VLGRPAPLVSKRLHRARRRFAAALAADVPSLEPMETAE
jgi:hypothetical protein